ncbi:hypothetical protein FRC19_010778 [Serendipita sp. 401]|nr:hypothetical protein FRC19_010778 [Serendipita sp. 401]
MTTKCENEPLQEQFPELPAELCGGQSLLFDYMELPPLSTIIPGSNIARERDGHLDVLQSELSTESSRPLWTDSALFHSDLIYSPALALSRLPASPMPTNVTEISFHGEHEQPHSRDSMSYDDLFIQLHPSDCCAESGAHFDAPQSRQTDQRRGQHQIPAWNTGRSSSFASNSGSSSFGSPSFSSASLPLPSLGATTSTAGTMRTNHTASNAVYPNEWQEINSLQGWLSSSCYSPSVSPMVSTTPLSLPDPQLHGSPMLSYPSLRRGGDEGFNPLPIPAYLPHARRDGYIRGKPRPFEGTIQTTKSARRRASSTVNIPHFCPECPRSFARARDLKRHFRLHSGERPYLCTGCGEAFIRSDARGRHFANNPSCGAVAAILANQQ